MVCYVILYCGVLCYVILRFVILRFVMLHYITLHYITLHYITLHYVALRCVALYYIILYYIILYYIILYYIILYYIILYYIILYYIILYYIILYYIILYYIILYYIILYYIILYYIILYYIILYYIPFCERANFCVHPHPVNHGSDSQWTTTFWEPLRSVNHYVMLELRLHNSTTGRWWRMLRGTCFSEGFCKFWLIILTQQIVDVGNVLFQCWPAVWEAGQTYKQQNTNVFFGLV